MSEFYATTSKQPARNVRAAIELGFVRFFRRQYYDLHTCLLT